MTTITFDTLKFANRLKQAGIPAAHAEAEAEAIAEVFASNLGELATKGDLLALERATKGDITIVKSDIAALRTELKADTREMELRMVIKLGTIVVLANAAFAAAVTALVKLL